MLSDGMNTLELNVINAAKAWRRALPDRKPRAERLLVMAVEKLEQVEQSKKKQRQARMKKCTLTTRGHLRVVR